MITRLVVSLRKTLDGSLVQVWNGDHFTAADENPTHEKMDFARLPAPPSILFSSFPGMDPRRSLRPDPPGLSNPEA